jgi:hypothetical protein
MKYVKQRMSMRFGNVRYSAEPGVAETRAEDRGEPDDVICALQLIGAEGGWLRIRRICERCPAGNP